jgi:hypothetical protein
VFTSERLIVLCLDELASMLPTTEKKIDFTIESLSMVFINFPVCGFHKQIVSSLDSAILARNDPSGENVTVETFLACASNLDICSPVCRFPDILPQLKQWGSFVPPAV